MVDDLISFCPKYQRAIELIGKRWSGSILRAMLMGACRFNEICATIPGLTDKMLSERLSEFEQEQIVIRQVSSEKPVRIEYVLTDKGRALESVIFALAEWAETWMLPVDRMDNPPNLRT